ncbi:endo alpha-1,4 polygalactosaminidase [Streptomyces sp. NPDC057757]|uniref:endo alpha-1,4 polygalactosaminidase n=1 Tax=Streptomyces sp. NPDC057757 TaxID=3346241 RepID=UPI00369204D5
MSLRPGDLESIGDYTLIDRLGSGGMGVVYLGRSTSGRRVAVKVVHAQYAQDEEFRARFRQEIAAVRRVSGAFTAPVVDADPDAEQPWMATLYVPGRTLADVVSNDGPLHGRELYALALGLVEALRDIHRVGVVHRDLKPSNVLMAEDGPRVIDFGISHAVDNQALTVTGRLIGTPPFMSPEQFASPRDVTVASDVFSLGSLLVYAATGNRPFDGSSPYLTGYQVMFEAPALDEVQEPLRSVAERCLDKDPGARPGLAELHGVFRALWDSAAAEEGDPVEVRGAEARGGSRAAEAQGAGAQGAGAQGAGTQGAESRGAEAAESGSGAGAGAGAGASAAHVSPGRQVSRTDSVLPEPVTSSGAGAADLTRIGQRRRGRRRVLVGLAAVVVVTGLSVTAVKTLSDQDRPSRSANAPEPTPSSTSPSDDASADSSPSSASAATVTLPPKHVRWDYQIGGAYPPPAGVRVVSRDWQDAPARGVYNICNINAFLVQEGAADEWDSDLLLRDDAGKVVYDEVWNEAVLDIRTEAKRKRVAAQVNSWIDACAAKGYKAVEPDNYDSFTRFPDYLEASQAKALMKLLSTHAHEKGLAIAQKNTLDLVTDRESVGLDFAVVEGCAEWNECGQFADAFDNNVFIVEYTAKGLSQVCPDWSSTLSVIRRDELVVPKGTKGYIHQSC